MVKTCETTITRRPSAKSVRELGQSSRLIGTIGNDNILGVLVIHVGDVSSEYTLQKVGSNFGDGFQLTKHVGAADFQTESYKTELSDQGHICTCPAGRHGKTCKHALALAALRLADRI